MKRYKDTMVRGWSGANADNTFYLELAKAIRNRLPHGSNLAATLMDILCLGKESVYRRLRGEVPFTLQEVLMLSKKFNISIDKILGENSSDGATFNLQLMYDNNEMDHYRNMLNYYYDIFSYVARHARSELYIASNILSFNLFPGYNMLARYMIHCWFYRNENIEWPLALTASEIPSDIMKLHDNVSDKVMEMGTTEFIWDTNVVKSIVKEMLYFHSLGVLSAAEVTGLKKELSHIVNYLEQLSINGRNEHGNQVNIYLSNVNLDAAYCYAECSDFRVSMFKIYSINSFDSQHNAICDMQRMWMRSLKRHSILISQSGERERRAFFSEQKRIIDNI